MAFLERQTTRVTGTTHESDGRRRSVTGNQSTTGVPGAKKPRSRPASSLRDRLPFPSRSLPQSSGPYSVGSMEIEVPVEHPRTISRLKRDGRHLLQLETVLFNLYYPAAFGSGSGEAPGGLEKWSRETWLPRPRIKTARGYARFAGIPDWTCISFFGATTMLTKLRSYRNTPPAKHWPPKGNAKDCGYTVRDQEGPAPEGMPEEPIFPVMMFTHGLGGTRTAYSSLCTEFASYGFIVCAVEHRDGSGPRSFINHPKPNTSGQNRDKPGPEERTGRDADLSDANQDFKYSGLDHTDEELERGWHHVVRNMVAL